MNLTKISVTNYRGLRDVEIPLSNFGCMIGENNAGKSSVLQALSLFFSGSKLRADDFFDESNPVRIAVTFENIVDADLSKLTDDHRKRTHEMIDAGCLTLVRLYNPDEKSSLLYETLTPTDSRFSPDEVANLVKGKKPGQKFLTTVISEFPELTNVVDETMNQTEMKEKIDELAASLPENEKVLTDMPLKTGMDKSIVAMLPDPIYIPAVKDLSDDIKTTESSPFGKIISILLNAIEPKLPAINKLFGELNEQLNIIDHEDGSVADNRLQEVKLIESTLQKYVRESFSDVAMRLVIPPPELKTIFSSARIYADDGVDGAIETKGDGLRRAIVFSILRSYVELEPKLSGEVEESAGEEQEKEKKAPAASYLLLFEEPELFLHPKAQHLLFDALRVFAKEHHVIVTTHSPMFFDAGVTETFVKLQKSSDPNVASKPFTQVQPIDLSTMAAKDQFQIICFENNNTALFSETVVLVEGDSDYLLMPHIAKSLNPDWNTAQGSVKFARITGKGNIRRYREFFERFGVRVPVIADLDILVGGFENVDPSHDIKKKHEELLKKVDALIVPEDEEPSQKEARKAHGSGELRGLWRKVKEFRKKLQEGECTQGEHDAAIDEFFNWQNKSERLDILKHSENEELLETKYHLLDCLRAYDIYVLERGAIEQYYPENVAGKDKPSQAKDFCEKVDSRDAVLACCDSQPVYRGGEWVWVKEFDLIFKNVFEN